MRNRIASIADVTELLHDAVWLIDAEGEIVFVSSAAERIFGYKPEEIIGTKLLNLVIPEDRERTQATAQQIMGGTPMTGFENRYTHKDGHIVHIMWSARWSEADQLRVGVARDITARKQLEAMHAALYHISEATQTTEDLPALFLRIHQIIASMLPTPGFAVVLLDEESKELCFSYDVDDRGPAQHHAVALELCQEVLIRREILILEEGMATVTSLGFEATDAIQDYWLGAPLSTPQGDIGVLLLHGTPFTTGYIRQQRELLLFVSTQIATAIQRKRLHTRLQFMALHDELTGLPNRRLFYDQLAMALARCQRQQSRLSLLFIDLNRFKQVNDWYGHEVGDLLLKEFARRMSKCVRQVDTVARIGGDEFAIMLDVAVEEDTILVKDKIHKALLPAFELNDDCRLQISASIGAAHYPEHGSNSKQLLRHADQMMYALKKQSESA
jgi:diguanylate cyclase (GGDEF)-like protein/PAS domain S-box-containing protein